MDQIASWGLVCLLWAFEIHMPRVYQCACIPAQSEYTIFFLSTVELEDDAYALSWLFVLVSHKFPQANSDGARAIFFLFFSVVLHGMWDLSSLIRDQTLVFFIGRQSVNHWSTREIPLGP